MIIVNDVYRSPAPVVFFRGHCRRRPVARPSAGNDGGEGAFGAGRLDGALHRLVREGLHCPWCDRRSGPSAQTGERSWLSEGGRRDFDLIR